MCVCMYVCMCKCMFSYLENLRLQKYVLGDWWTPSQLMLSITLLVLMVDSGL